MEGNGKLQLGCPYFVKNINLERPVQSKHYKNCLEQKPPAPTAVPALVIWFPKPGAMQAL